MCENGSLSQHRYFLHDKSSNNESLQIYKYWYDHNDQFFEIVLYYKTYRLLYGERVGIFVNVAIYVILCALRSTMGCIRSLDHV